MYLSLSPDSRITAQSIMEMTVLLMQALQKIRPIFSRKIMCCKPHTLPNTLQRQ